MTQKPAITPQEHSDIVGGSTAGRVLKCPGSVKLVRAAKNAHKQRIVAAHVAEGNLPAGSRLASLKPKQLELVEKLYREETTTIYAAEGTGLHEAIAHVLDKDLEDTADTVGQTFEGIEITPTLNTDALAPALRSFDAYLARVYEEDGEDLVFTVEERCAFPTLEGVFGTADVVGRTSKRIMVWDWKFGAGVRVEVEENEQLRFYGRAAIHTKAKFFKPLERDGDIPLDMKVDLIICQPRIGDGEPSFWSTTYADLLDFEDRLVGAVKAAQGDEPEVKQGDHCRWCEAKHICPAKQQIGQRVLEVSAKARAKVEEKAPGKKVVLSKLFRDGEAVYTPDDLAQWLDDAKDIEAWCKWVKEMAMAELTAGRKVAGKELDQGLGDASWKPDDQAVELVLKAHGFDIETRRPKLISPTQARKHLKDNGGTAAASEAIEAIIHRPDAGPRIVDEGKAKNRITGMGETAEKLGAQLKRVGAK